MQVFLPFFDFRLVALCLDNKRLNKQLVEAYQIITKRLSYTHMRHPAVLLWEPYLGTLADYAAVLCEEYHNRFHKIHKVAESKSNMLVFERKFRRWKTHFAFPSCKLAS